MSDQLFELIHLIARWVHLIAGIMWIGNSLLFNWLDRNLVVPPGNTKKGLVGEIWMVHSGGFYQVEKKFLEPSGLPETLHWFKWQNGITWLSGIWLLVLVYYMGGAALMTDPQVATIAPRTAVLIGVASLIVSFGLYDLLWRSAIGKKPVLAFVLSLAVVVGFSALFFKLMSGRAAYMHVGVMLGTLMTGNVWFVIIPSQREMVNATREGREQDPKIGYQAKQRSIHNNYMTFPLLFIMISNHFPSTFGNKLNWLVLLILAVGSALIRHLMNIRFTFRRWLGPAIATFFFTCLGAWALMAFPEGFGNRPRVITINRPVPYAEASALIQSRCTPCHSQRTTHPAFPVAPNGVMFDTQEQVVRNAARIRFRSFAVRTMPLANLTNMTDEERAILAAWVDQGSHAP